MDRSFWYRFCHNVKCCLFMAGFGVLAATVLGMYTPAAGGQITFGIGLILLPIIGSSAQLVHIVQSEFAPEPATQQKQTTP